MSKTQTDYMLTLSYLLGERTIPSNGVESRRSFVQETLNEIYRAYPWPFASARQTLSVASGVATLATTFDYQQKLEAYFYAGDNQVNMEEIQEDDQPNYVSGDKVYWVENQSDGTYLLKTKDTTVTSVNVRFQTLVPQVNATITSPFDDTMTVALGARRYVKLSQDPNADVSQDEALFQKRLNENIAAVQVNRPTRKVKIKAFMNNHRVGGGYE